MEGYYYKPRVDLEVLEKYHEGIIALSACLAGEIPRFLTRGLYEEGKRAALRYREIFGKNNFFLELQNHGIREQEIVNQQLVRMSSETGIELVCTNDVHYHLCGRCRLPRYPSLYPDRKKSAGRGPYAL